MGSNRFTLDWADGLKVLTGTLIAAAGAGVTYLSQWATDADFGEWTPAVVAMASILVNMARKWLSDNSKTKVN